MFRVEAPHGRSQQSTHLCIRVVHPKIGSNPTELRQLVTGANCVGVERRSRAPRHRDELRDDWEPQDAGSCVPRGFQELSFESNMKEVFVYPSNHILQGNLDLNHFWLSLEKKECNLATTTTVGTHLVLVFDSEVHHDVACCRQMGKSSHPDSQMDQWALHDTPNNFSPFH